MSKSKIKNKIKSKIKELGKKAALNCLVSLYNSKANRHSGGKSRRYRKKAKRYRSRLEEITREAAKNSTPTKGYHASMEDLYQKYEAQNDSSTSEVGKIFAGDYRENGKRIWYWKDRVKKIEDYLENKQGLSENAQRQIFGILNKNRYFMTKKKIELALLKNILFKNEGITREITDYLQRTTSYQEPEKHTPKIIEEDDQFWERRLVDNQEKEGEQTTSEPLETTLEREEVEYDGKIATLPSEGDLIVVGQLKGNLKDFENVIEKFEEEYSYNNKTYLLLLGNYLNFEKQENGPSRISLDSIKILDQLIELKKKYGDNIISLVGKDELLHYQRDAVHGSTCAWTDYGLDVKKEQIENHAKFLNNQPVAAQIPNKLLFAASGQFNWVKILENLIYHEGDLPKKSDNFQNETYSLDAYINAKRMLLDNLGLKNALYGDRTIFEEINLKQVGLNRDFNQK